MPSDHEQVPWHARQHGKGAANRAIHEATSIIIKRAFGRPLCAAPARSATRSKIIHIDVTRRNRENIGTTVPIVGDMKNVIDKLTDGVGGYHIPHLWEDTVTRAKTGALPYAP